MSDDLLDRRTEALARPVDLSAAVLDHYLLVRTGGESFALDPRHVRAVAELRRITPLPHTPPRVLGLTSRAGGILPVFDLRAALGLPLSTLPEHGRIVILGDDADEVALAVDAVAGSIDVRAEDVAAMPTTASAALRRFARGVVPGPAVVLDLQALLASELLTIDVVTPR